MYSDHGAQGGDAFFLDFWPGDGNANVHLLSYNHKNPRLHPACGIGRYMELFPHIGYAHIIQSSGNRFGRMLAIIDTDVVRSTISLLNNNK